MSWFRHHFHCEACAGSWLVEAAAVVQSDCPLCGARDVFAYKSDDRSVLVERRHKNRSSPRQRGPRVKNSAPHAAALDSRLRGNERR